MARLNNWVIILLWVAGVIAGVFSQWVVAAALLLYPAGNGLINAAFDLYTGCIRWKD